MKKTLFATLVGLAVTAAAAPAAAVGAATPAHRCVPSLRSFVSLSATPNVSCAKARALNVYMATHETLDGPFNWQSGTWTGTIYSRLHNATYMVYRQGAEAVWIVYPSPAS
ncbi:MAG: hypothetical protein WAL63_08290 [Solirubrobacteraceae bacterium]